MIDPLDPIRPRRRSIRLRGHDYSRAGAYFVTICAQDRACLFGDVVDGVMQTNDAGAMITEHWTALPHRFPTIILDEFVVMPNHFHGVMIMHDTSGAGGHEGRPYDDVNAHVGAPLVGARLGQVIGAFKSTTTVAYGRGVRRFAWPTFRGRLWQRNYYEHIVRNEAEMDRIRLYIAENPRRWAQDRENPACVGAPLVGAQDWEVA